MVTVTILAGALPPATYGQTFYAHFSAKATRTADHSAQGSNPDFEAVLSARAMQHTADVNLTTDIVFRAGPERRLIFLEFPLEVGAISLSISVEVPDGYDLSVSDARIILGTTAYRTDHNGAHYIGDVTAPGWWQQTGRVLIYTCYWGRYRATMPEGWQLAEVHRNCLAASEYLLRHMIDRKFEAPDLAKKFWRARFSDSKRRMDSGVLLAFSGGIDSVAAAKILPPETVKIFCERDYDHYYKADGRKVTLRDPAAELRVVDETDGAVRIPNDFERLGLAAGFRHGFTEGMGYAAVLLLVADFFKAGHIAAGAPLEVVFMGASGNYQDVIRIPGSKYNGMNAFLAAAGLRTAYVVGACSEAITSHIVRVTGARAAFCPRADRHGVPCGTCFKCFRKLRHLNGHGAPPSRQVLDALAKRPLPVALSTMRAIQSAQEHYDSVAEFEDVDLGFVARYHGYAVDQLLNAEIAAHVRERFAAMGIEPMTSEDEKKLRGIGRIFNPSAFDAKRAGFEGDES